ncbi:hypothetical protein QT972_00360 [Microcoleus sp. herbarium7]|uniref:hypothetical protein n=1 Tax=Microcoleus sp. herbarium7 TaxID=3055435 RepID=UPI002FD5D01E
MVTTMKYSDLPERVHDAKVEAAVDAINLLAYDKSLDWAHLIFANIFVGAKHSGSKSVVITNKLPAGMLRPSKIEMHPSNN